MATANIANTKIVPSETTLTPYYDDFVEEKNFHRILFRPGYAVQARELTQIQTILQNQIERFGNHIFKNGSLVLGGQISYDNSATYLNLKSQYNSTDIVASNFLANTIYYSSGNTTVRAHVFGTRELTDTDPPVLVIKYLTGDEFGANSSIKSNEEVYATLTTSAHTGTATLVSINDGIFYINGYFVKVPAQTIVVDKYSSQANAKIGLEYSDDIIDESDDTTLLDPAQEASNYQAPGATRLRINFDLVARSLDSIDDEKFVEILRVENGIIKKVIRTAIYSEIGDTLARRTFDESGDYTVKRFKISLNSHPSDETKLQVVLDPGKAYLKGYEIETISQEKIDLEKARETSNVNNRDVSVSLGNYVYVQNVNGVFDSSTMELVDIHCVDSNAISTTTATTYASSKIGTARLKQLRHYYTSNTNFSDAYVYRMSLFDTKFSNLTSNVIASSSNGLSLYSTAGKLANVNGAYVGSTIRITSGDGIGEAYEITNYTQATRTFNIAEYWITPPTGGAGGSNVSIDFDFDSAKSIAKNSTYTPGTPSTATANVHSLSRNQTTGYSYFSDRTRNSLVFPLSDFYVKSGSITDQDYEYVAKKSITFASGTGSGDIVLDPGQSFYASVSDSVGDSDSTLSGFIVFRTDTGRRVRVNTSISGTTATLRIPGEGGSVAATAFVRVNLDDSSQSFLKPKSKIYRTSNTNLTFALGTPLTQTTSAGTTTMYVNDTNTQSQIVISNPSNLPGEKMSLFISDVISIKKIYDVGDGVFPGANTLFSTMTDVTDKYSFDNGQKDTHYDHSTIALKAKSGELKGPLIVCFDWYDHTSGSSDGSGYFSVDSYSTEYATIPSYKASDGSIISLRDAIDFRPKRANKSSTSPNYTLEGLRIPTGDTSFELDYQYYLARKSLVCLTKDADVPFRVVDGISGKNPVDPRAPDETMSLYMLTLEPYTLGSSNVFIRFIENKRYTMRDIGKLETRIQNLEYYQALTLLEKQTDSMKILDVNGLERTKYGFIADDFRTHTYGDVDNDDYIISIDTAEGGLFPAENVRVLGLQTASLTNIKNYEEEAITLDFTEELFVNQNTATKWVNVQPYMLAKWIGSIVMDPPGDYWVDTTSSPVVLIDYGQYILFRKRKVFFLGYPFGFNKNWWRRWYGLPLKYVYTTINLDSAIPVTSLGPGAPFVLNNLF